MTCTYLMCAVPFGTFTAAVPAWVFEHHETLLLGPLEVACLHLLGMRATSCRLQRVIFWVTSAFPMPGLSH
jgi:hypothetical protein